MASNPQPEVEERVEMLELIVDLVSHLDYTGWGRDSWEREVSEELRRRVDEFKTKHPEEFQ